MFTNPTPLHSAEAGIHKHPLLRRVTSSIVGALLSLAVYSIYEDISMAIRVHAMAADAVQETTIDDSAARIKAFAEQLKQERAE